MMFNFSYVLPGKLAGMECPGRLDDLETDLSEITANGIGAVVSLTERKLNTMIIRKSGMKYLHLPVRDFTPPSLVQIERFVNFVDDCLAEDRAVAVHCGAGIGRTGTMLACYLVHTGTSPEEAIRTIRNKRRGSIETSDQEQVIHSWAAASLR